MAVNADDLVSKIASIGSRIQQELALDAVNFIQNVLLEKVQDGDREYYKPRGFDLKLGDNKPIHLQLMNLVKVKAVPVKTFRVKFTTPINLSDGEHVEATLKRGLTKSTEAEIEVEFSAEDLPDAFELLQNHLEAQFNRELQTERKDTDERREESGESEPAA